MKIWKKIFIYSLVLFLTVFNLGAFFIIENNHNLILKREIDRGLSEHLSIYSGLKGNLLFLKERVGDTRISRKNIYNLTINDFMKNFNDKNMYIEILDSENEVVFSNLDFDITNERTELKKPLEERRSYIIRDVGNRTFLFITNLMNIGKESLSVSYVRDITSIYNNRKDQYIFFAKLDIIISIILAIGMYLLSKYITEPINELTNVTRRISSGSVSERAQINSNDEIGILAENFNKMSDAIEDKINQLEKNAEEKQRFTDNLTHEMKTPLTCIIGYADFLRSTKYNEKTFIEGLNNIFREGKRLEELSGKMMNLILLKKENFKMNMVEMKVILDEIKNALKPKLDNKKIELVTSGENQKVIVEKDLIKVLISNLIDNAIKASELNGKVYVNIYTNEDLKTVVEIKDEGIGISEEDLPKVFEPFYMVDKSRTRSHNGSGLGLSICNEIANLHEAKLQIESRLSEGTTVKIIFS